VHTPALQVSPCAQAVLQLPQWFGSVEVSAQVVQQMAFPAGQLHWPLTHEWPVGHAVPQLPQWFGSVDRLTHPMTPPQFTSPALLDVPGVHSRSAHANANFARLGSRIGHLTDAEYLARRRPFRSYHAARTPGRYIARRDRQIP
jgi:hypothetical protein